jgi:hypothetical protein
MSTFFPRNTAEWRIEEPAALRKLTMSLAEMTIITGVTIRLLRSIALTYGGGESWLYLGGTFALGVVILCGMLAAHLSNFTLRTWLWRAPAFALCETLAEMATSAVLIAFQREPIGSRERAEFADLPAMAEVTFLIRFSAIIGFALVLAAVVYLVRYALIKRERTASGAEAVRAELDAPETLETK